MSRERLCFRTWVLFLGLLAAVAACVGCRPCSAGSLPVLLQLTFIRVEEEGRGESPCLSQVFHWGNVCDECQPCLRAGDGERGTCHAGGSRGAEGSPRAAWHLPAGGSYWRPVLWCWRNGAGWSLFCNVFSSFLFLLLCGAQSAGVEEAWLCQPGFVILESPSLSRATCGGVGRCPF